MSTFALEALIPGVDLLVNHVSNQSLSALNKLLTLPSFRSYTNHVHVCIYFSLRRFSDE
jgi:hypothetical protein